MHAHAGKLLHFKFSISTMIFKFSVFTGKIEHVHTVCTRPSLSEEGSGDKATLPDVVLQLGQGLDSRQKEQLYTSCSKHKDTLERQHGY